MKITLWGINYAPELVGIAPFNRELGEYLAGRGHAVTAVTAFPYYPSWRKQPGDRGRWHRAETAGGVDVQRCWCYVPAVVTPLRRIAHELSFGLSSLWRVLVLPRADIYVVVSPPLALGFFAWVATTCKRSRFVFHVQDLQPDAAVGLGMIRRGAFVRALYALERLAYAKAAAVSGISAGMMTAFAAKQVAADKCVLLPNWLRQAAAGEGSASTDRAAARQRWGVASGTLLAVYAGNLGRKQGSEILLAAAALLPAGLARGAAGIRLIIAGDGAARSDLERSLRARPEGAVRLLPLLSDDDHTALLAAADIALITQAAGSGVFFFPSKLLSVLAAGLPVLAVADADSELAAAIRTGGFGASVRPGDAAGLAALLVGIHACRGRLAAWAGHTAWVRQFSREAILPRFEAMLLAAAQVPQPAGPARREAAAPA